MFKPDTCCTLVPYFEVPEGQLAAFKALGPQFVERTRTEPGCMHYAFSFNGTTAHCREGYANAEAVLAHLQNVGELLGQALQIANGFTQPAVFRPGAGHPARQRGLSPRSNGLAAPSRTDHRSPKPFVAHFRAVFVLSQREVVIYSYRFRSSQDGRSSR